jgi:dienelactone hydrolase
LRNSARERRSAKTGTAFTAPSVFCARAARAVPGFRFAFSAGLSLFLLAAVAFGAEPAPLVVLVGPAPETWAAVAAQRGWELAAVGEMPAGDAAVRQIAGAVEEAGKRRAIDPARIYIAGLGSSAAAAFYAVSRRPDLWTAALAAGGGVEPAIETNRLFGANAHLIPILWLMSPQDDAELGPARAKLAAKGFDIELRTAPASVDQAFDWLAGHTRFPYPPKIDCETGSPEFRRCYWLELTGFDATARNDVLPLSRVPPGPGAHLEFGPFGFDVSAPGPGVPVAWLPPNYAGPLHLSDRIVSVGGTPIKDAREYVRFMAGQRNERALGVVVERDKHRQRLETRIALAKRGENSTARVQAEYLMDTHEVLVITRGANEFRLDLPSFWVPCAVNWNGNNAGRADSAGCWVVASGAPARKCD